LNLKFIVNTNRSRSMSKNIQAKISDEIKKISKFSDDILEIYFMESDLEFLQKMKLYLDDIYYNTGKSSGLDDWQYDLLKEILEIRDPYYVPVVGAKIRQNENKIELPFWLGSMNKFKPEDESDLFRWIKKHTAEEYIIEDKLDGISCLLIVQDGKLKLYTRGDGIIGSDISYFAQYFKNIPNITKHIKNISVRGELIMKESVFKEKYANEFANPRNFVSGRIGSKTVRDGLSDIEFIAYEIVDTGVLIKPEEQLLNLSNMGFKTVPYVIIPEITVENLVEIIYLRKTESEFEIDGIIVQKNTPYVRNIKGNPDYAFAFKVRMNSNLINAEVEEVLWNVSKWGLIKPRIRIKPIKLSGVTITYTSGFNAKYIEDNQIGPGTILKMTRSGDVIPFIVEVVKSTEAQFPDDIPYIWNETHVDIILERDDDKDTNEMCIKIVSSFFASLKIKHVSEATVSKMYNHGLDNILKIVSAKQEDFEKIEGFGKRLAERTYENIHNGLQNISLSTLLGASGVFGMSIGKRKTEILLDAIPDLLDIYKLISKEELTELINGVEGFSDKTTAKIIENLPWADKFYENIKPYTTIKQKITASDDLKKMKVVFSGFRNLELEEHVKTRGGKVVTSVSKNTTALVVSDKDSKSSKIQKAIDLGINIYDEEEFKDTFRL